MYKILSEYQKLLNQMIQHIYIEGQNDYLHLYFINYSIFIQESKSQHTVLPGLFIPYQLEYII